ncbi:MAG: two-component system sensor histidine kinase NtrB [Acidobacteriota bacterium]
MQANHSAPWKRFLPRAQDAVWLLLFSALAWVSPTRGPAEIEVLSALAVLQVAAPRARAFQSPRGNLALISLKLLLGFLLIGVTGGIASSYYLILLLPVLSAATTLGPAGTAVFTALACLAYLAFIPVAYNLGYILEGLYLRDLTLRVLFLPVVAYLTYSLAEANRRAARRAEAAAAELAEVNRRLLEAEASARRSERLAALGQLTAGLAHELRNPLGTMKASAEMLMDRAPADNAVVRELAEYISAEVDRTNSLITRFLEFARPLRLEKTPADIHTVLDSAIEHLDRESPGSAARIHRNYDPALPLIEADAELIERVFFNLLRNALEASPPGALVTVKTRRSPQGVEIAVIDRGPGVPPEHREQIFNPFFTTKPGGVGLGLAISAKIVGDHGGVISVDSEPDAGAIFLVSLPASSG